MFLLEGLYPKNMMDSETIVGSNNAEMAKPVSFRLSTWVLFGQETGLDNSFKKRNYLFFALLLKAKRVLYIKNSILTNGKLWHQVLSSTIKLYHSCHTYRLFPVCILIWILKELLCEKDFFTLTALVCFFPSMRLHMFYKKNNL